MAKPKDILAQLLSPAQAETLDAAGGQIWPAAAAALQSITGAALSLEGADGRLVMPDEIIGEFAASHMVLPIELTTARDQAATAYAAVDTPDAAAFFGASAEDVAGQEQELSIVAGAVLGQLISALIFSAIGILMFGLAFLMMKKLLPFNIYKEIEEDQNIALGILMASVMIGIAIIISSAIR